jgi:hypothetical protein
MGHGSVPCPMESRISCQRVSLAAFPSNGWRARSLRGTAAGLLVELADVDGIGSRRTAFWSSDDTECAIRGGRSACCSRAKFPYPSQMDVYIRTMPVIGFAYLPRASAKSIAGAILRFRVPIVSISRPWRRVRALPGRASAIGSRPAAIDPLEKAAPLAEARSSQSGPTGWHAASPCHAAGRGEAIVGQCGGAACC